QLASWFVNNAIYSKNVVWLIQIICYTWFGSDTLKLKSIRAGLRKLNLVEDRAIARSPVKIVPTSMAKEFAGVN
ncbi:hypothetical protein HN51_054605, partial [Arachis hypogaea]